MGWPIRKRSPRFNHRASWGLALAGLLALGRAPLPPEGTPVPTSPTEDPRAVAAEQALLRERATHRPAAPRRRRSPCAAKGVVCRGALPLVALTFDDCFRTEEIPPLLEALRAAGARATFFCIGWVLRAHPEIARQIVAEGHELGNHTLRHRFLNVLPQQEMEAELDGWQAAAEEALGRTYPTRWFRPPGMAGFTSEANPEILEAVRRRGMRVALWTLETYRPFFAQGRPDPAAIAAYLRENVRGGEIVLLHVSRPEVEGVRAALPDLAARFRLVTMSEMFPPEAEGGGGALSRGHSLRPISPVIARPTGRPPR